MACCTASTVHHLLPPDIRELCVPIIEPGARRALSLTSVGKIGVIATERTVSSGAFERAVRKIAPSVSVISVSAQPLVSIIEGGERDGGVSEDTVSYLKLTLSPLLSAGIDVLILGCTHFPLLAGTISSLIGDVALVSSAREGAIEMKRLSSSNGCGITKYISEKKGR